ncbi:MAG TPA: class I adenylate cyclase [Gammaproteobacteria bacterium]|nr:class I adenylate cyclase [Gammaproteobacteria bacterium]
MEISAAKKRFMALNRERLVRAHACLSHKQQSFLEVLPLLFHTNHPAFPGFISKSTPKGISDYTPAKKILDIAKNLARSFEYKKRALSHYEIYSLFLMGSSGTVAYSKKSDFDIWVCHSKQIEADKLDELQQKAKALEEWAITFDLEVHFFLVEPESFRQGHTEQLSSESSGSAQYHLLLEEFYRTSLLLAGRYPIWWLIPPGKEHEYDKQAQHLIKQRFVAENECIDLGGIDFIPPEEFFGAALWQLYKGVDSPYKSVLKILLMEIYASEYPNIDLLSARFKSAIYSGITQLDKIDPYVILIKKIEEYLEQRQEKERLQLARRCFYFKANEQLSKTSPSRQEGWRYQLLHNLVTTWGWTQQEIKVLDERNSWKIVKVQKEREILVGELTRSYQFLSEFARKHAKEANISQQDMTILGRKLYAAFERKAGKVEIINRGIAPNLWESQLSFYQTSGQNQQSQWLLFTGQITATEIEITPPIKRGRNLFELITWCFFNRLLDARTDITLNAPNSPLTIKELQLIINALEDHFFSKTLTDASFEALMQPAKIKKSLLFINLGIDPMESRTREGIHLTSDRTDSLSYGGLHENLAIHFDQVTLTSWKEVQVICHRTKELGLLDSLCQYINQGVPAKKEAPPSIETYCFTPTRGIAISKRINDLFNDVVKCFYGPHAEAARYLFIASQTHYVLKLKNNTLQYEVLEDTKMLLPFLEQESSQFSPVVFDRHVLTNSPLPILYLINEPGTVQLFFQESDNEISVFILDERGSLYQQRESYFSLKSMLSQYKLFIDSVIDRQRFQYSEDEIKDLATTLKCYQINKTKENGFQIIPRNINHLNRAQGYFNMQVIVEADEHNQAIFTFYCDGQEFSSLEFGQTLYDKVAAYVLEKRQSGLAYPIYITDLDVPRSLLGGQAEYAQTIHFLNYKKQVESKLNEALELLAVPSDR